MLSTLTQARRTHEAQDKDKDKAKGQGRRGWAA